jgi:hypothetical protein
LSGLTLFGDGHDVTALRITIEASTKDLPGEVPLAIALLRKAFK